MHKVVLIPDSFKGTMSSAEICSIMASAIAQHFPDAEVVSLPVADGGEGSVDAFLAALREIDYAGWLVVEQDIFPTTAEKFAQAAADQRANREFLRERGL